MTIFEQVIGNDYNSLPQTLQDMHRLKYKTWRGEASIQAARNPLAKLIARCVGLSIKSGDVPVTVTFMADAAGEHWIRDFDGRIFKSHFSLGTGSNKHLAVERFGIAKIGLALLKDKEKLHFIPRRCTVLGIPLPKFLLPKGESYETEKDGKFHFDVTIKLPLIGLIAAYEGWLEPKPQSEELNNIA